MQFQFSVGFSTRQPQTTKLLLDPKAMHEGKERRHRDETLGSSKFEERDGRKRAFGREAKQMAVHAFDGRSPWAPGGVQGISSPVHRSREAAEVYASGIRPYMVHHYTDPSTHHACGGLPTCKLHRKDCFYFSRVHQPGDQVQACYCTLYMP